MIKRLIVTLSALTILTACATKEEKGLKEVLIERFKDDQDLKDYRLDPSVVADCVLKEIAESLPGFGGDPRRDEYFAAYARFFSVRSPGEAEKAIADYEKLFGSPQKARAAANSMSDHIMTCMGKAIESADGPPQHN